MKLLYRLLLLICLSLLPAVLLSKECVAVFDDPSSLAKRDGFFIEIPLEISFNSIEVVANGFFKRLVDEYPRVSNLTFTGLLGNLRKRYSGTCNMFDARTYINIENKNKALCIFADSNLVNKKYKTKSQSGLFEKETNDFYTEFRFGASAGVGVYIYNNGKLSFLLGSSVILAQLLKSDGLSIDNDYIKFKDDVKNYDFLNQHWNKSFELGGGVALTSTFIDNYSLSLILKNRNFLSLSQSYVLDFRLGADLNGSRGHKYNIFLNIDDMTSRSFGLCNISLIISAMYKRLLKSELEVTLKSVNITSSIYLGCFALSLSTGKKINRTYNSSNYFASVVLKYIYDKK